MDLPHPDAEQSGPSPVVHGTIIERFLRMSPILWLQPFRLSIDARGEFTGECPLRSGSDRIAVLLRNDAMGQQRTFRPARHGDLRRKPLSEDHRQGNWRKPSSDMHARRRPNRGYDQKIAQDFHALRQRAPGGVIRDAVWSCCRLLRPSFPKVRWCESGPTTKHR